MTENQGELVSLAKEEELPCGFQGIEPRWKLRLATYSNGSRYIEAWSNTIKSWVIVRKTRIGFPRHGI